MTRIVFVSEIPVSYRHGWFAHLREHSDLDVRVLYLAGGQTDRPWEATADRADWCRVLSSRTFETLRGGFLARMTPSIGRELATEAPDFVLLPGWAYPSAWHAALWCRRHGVPYGVMFENWKPQSKTSMPVEVTSRIRRAVLDGAAVALPAGARAAAFAATITDRPCRILHANVADVDEARKATLHLDGARDRRVLYMGRLLPHKGIDLVLDMAASLQASGIEVDVAGDGERRPEVEAAAREGALTFHGVVRGGTKFELLARSGVVVVPSLAEPWGVVVQEALASGTPVLASAEVGCAPEFIEPGTTGAVLCPDRGSFESTVRSWIENVEPDREACVASANRITYASVAAELEAIVTEVVP